MSKIILRKAAKAAGLTRYFTGRPCPWGHVAERQVSGRRCLECRRLYKRSAEGREANARYGASSKGLESYRRYSSSPKGRERQRGYAASPKGREMNCRYNSSPKGRDKKFRHSQTEKCRERARQRQHRPLYRAKANERVREHRLAEFCDHTRPDYDPARAARLIAKRQRDGR
jgi:hypothetical protein